MKSVAVHDQKKVALNIISIPNCTAPVAAALPAPQCHRPVAVAIRRRRPHRSLALNLDDTDVSDRLDLGIKKWRLNHENVGLNIVQYINHQKLEF